MVLVRLQVSKYVYQTVGHLAIQTMPSISTLTRTFYKIIDLMHSKLRFLIHF